MVIIQVRYNGRSDKVEAVGMWDVTNSRYVLKVNPTGFADRLNIG